jgi:hypothetical protein
MIDESNHINNFTAEDIRRYLNNEMSEQEMHAIEKAAMEDPFLADAIDGMKEAFDSHGEQQVMLELSNLNSQLADRTRDKKVVPIKFGLIKWSAAAAILLVAGSTYFILNIRKTKEYADSFKASNSQKAGKSNDVVADSTPVVAIQPPPAKSRVPVADQRLNKSSNSAIKPAAAESVAILEKRNKDVAAQKKEAFAEDKEQQPTADLIRTDSVSKAVAARAAGISADKPMDDSDKEIYKTLQGKIVDPNGNPLSNATITAPKINKAVFSDSNGNFFLPSRESVSEVNISAVGYQNAFYKISETARNQLVLNPSSAALNEVVVTESKGKIKPALEESDGEATPTIGWVAYNKYLEQSKKLPVSKSNIASYVIVSFNVYSDGTTGKFKIEQPVTDTYNREAIRLIKEGPAWKLVSGKKARVRLQVRF